ncbi:hypothetical protein [Pontibacter flavimaris]|uniref:STAS/SEC14 domain-containing protein n=1 Tax=Pontibacter flavimaris TaxID=1797110 RepID=A0A1Q5PHK6_9BACT|nr:hypothetical protein [Pontibacter flavimaris]OKL41671.1 hypothetical protein A3841_11610 [Pontibacter flavimaris]
MVIFNTPGVNITFQEQERLLLIHWLKKPDMELLMDAYLHALQFVCDNRHTYYFCTNQTQIGPLDREQEAWLSQEYYPKVFECIQDEIYAAVVFSNAHFKAIVTNYQVPATLPQHHFIQFNYFTKQQEALQWLSDVKKGQDVAVIARTN